MVEDLIDSGDDKDKIMKVFKKEKDLTNMAEIQDYLWAQPLMHWMEGGSLSYTMPVIGYVG